MWTRAELKERAKGMLRRNYWKALIVSLVIVIAGGGSVNFSNSSNNNRKSTSTTNADIWRDIEVTDIKAYTGRVNDYVRRGGDVINTYAYRVGDRVPGGNVLSWVTSTVVGAIVGLLALTTLAVKLLFRVLAGYHLEVGGKKFFIRAAESGETNMSYLSGYFKGGRYTMVMGTMFLRSLYTFLWSLLFIIPGIVKSYAYKMVPYILADNPEIGYNRALELSSRMTDGHKFEMFVLDLSFIGWYFLGALLCGVGTFFVNPYTEATYAELYLTLKQNAADSGTAGYGELGMRLQ